MTLLSIILASCSIAFLSLIGLFLFSISQKSLEKGLLILVALSAGAMFGNAFFHLLPEIVEQTVDGPITLFTALLIAASAFVLSFLFEQIFSWHHCHHAEHCEVKKPFGHLTLVSDAIHNCVDGIILATSFIVSPTLGILTTITIALHEVPQELGDFAVLLYSGWQKRQALVVNFFAALSVVFGGILGFYLTQTVSASVPVLISFAMGSFLYIATSDLIPELKHQTHFKPMAMYTLAFLFGLSMMVISARLE